MTPQAQRIAIAKACGITVCHSCKNMIDETCCCCGSPMENHSNHEGHTPTPAGCRCGYDKQPQSSWGGVPDYLTDLNAMQCAEEALPDEQHSEYRGKLVEVCDSLADALCATASQRAEAFLRTLNLWDETK